MKAEFVVIPDFSIHKDGTWAEPEQWWLKGPCVYHSNIEDPDGNLIVVEVPDRFKTDLSSIPRIFRLLIPKNGRHRAAAVVHDWLCRNADFGREITDKVFLEAMVLLEVPKWRRHLMYRAVRIGAFFKRKKK